MMDETPERPTPMNVWLWLRRRVGLPILLGFALFMVCALAWLWPAWVETAGTIRDTSEHMEYAWMIPLLSAAVLASRWRQVLASLGRPAPLRALPLILLAAVFFFLGSRGGQVRFIQASAVLLLLAAPLACFGWRTFKVTWFPIVLLGFLMPVGFLDGFTVPLRRASVSVAAVILNGLGVAVEQRGTAILSTGAMPFQLDVADPCSGIRSLVALFVGTAAYGAFMLRGVWRRWGLFLASVPIAFLGNIVRLLLTALVCQWYGQTAGMTLHDNALFIVAPLYAGIVFWLTDLLRRGDRPAEPLAPAAEPLRPKAWTLAVLAAIALSLPAFRIWVRSAPETVYESADFLAADFAPMEGYTLAYPWFCQSRTCTWYQPFAASADRPEACPLCGEKVARMTRAESDILPGDTTTRKAIYRRADGVDFTLALVIAGESRRSIHRPELCLPAQGYVIGQRDVREVIPEVPMALFSIHRKGETRTAGFAYIFLNADGATVSNLKRVVGDTLERSLNNRIRRWAMVTIRSDRVDFRTPEGEAELRAFMERWWPTLWAEGRQPHE